jgi:dynein assembly factor 2, axonemal
MSTSSTSGGIKPMPELNSEQLKAMFDASVKKEGSETANFSSDEKDRFVKAFDDPEFRKLFSNYMDELQDPANRAETETYISQLEST